MCVCGFVGKGVGVCDKSVENSFGRKTETSGENAVRCFAQKTQLSHTTAVSVNAAASTSCHSAPERKV